MILHNIAQYAIIIAVEKKQSAAKQTFVFQRKLDIGRESASLQV